MNQSLLRTPKAGISLRGKMKKVPRSDLKSRGNPKSEDLDASFSSSPPQISSITDNLSTTSSNSVIAAAADLDEVESNYLNAPLLLENSDQSSIPECSPAPLVESVGSATENVKEANTSIAPPPALFIEDGGGRCVEEILTKLSEVAAQPEEQIITGKHSEKDAGEPNLEVVLAGFSTAMEKLCDATRQVLLPAIEQRKRRNGNDGDFFFVVRLGEMALAFFIGAVLISVLLTAVAPEGNLILDKLSEFNGPTPT